MSALFCSDASVSVLVSCGLFCHVHCHLTEGEALSLQVHLRYTPTLRHGDKDAHATLLSLLPQVEENG